MNISILHLVLICLLPPLFYGLSGIVDSKLVRYPELEQPPTLVFVNNMTSLLLALLLLVVSPLLPTPITLPPSNLVPILIIVGLLEFLYLFPYYKAYTHLDTSVVNALFSLARVMTPLLAFFMVNEILSVKQYLGFFIIVISSAVLSLEKGERFKLNAGFWLMVLAGGLIVFDHAAMKMATYEIDWLNLFFWSMLIATLSSFSILLSPTSRSRIKASLRLPSLKKYARWLVLTQALYFIASGLFVFAVAMVPITLVEVGLSFQPILVLAASYILFKLFRMKRHEQKTAYTRKVICFVIMLFGSALII